MEREEEAEIREEALWQKRFSHIYVERALRDTAEAAAILARFPDARRIEISHYKDVFNRKGQNYGLQHRSQKLILAKKQGVLLYPGAPVCQGFGNEHFYYSSCVMNCIFDCEYCYLKGMYPSGNLLLFLNLEDIFAELRELVERHPVYLCVSYDTDLLALEGLLGYVRRWAEFVRDTPGLSVEIRTKSGAESFWEGLADVFSEAEKEKQRLIFAYSLSPEKIIRDYEHFTGSLERRIESARAGLECGFPIRFCFDPMIFCPDWRQAYGEMLSVLEKKFPMERVRDVSVGSFRVSEEYLKAMRHAVPQCAVVQYPFENQQGVYGYRRALTEEMEGFLTEALGKWLPEERIFRWGAGQEQK